MKGEEYRTINKMSFGKQSMLNGIFTAITILVEGCGVYPQMNVVRQCRHSKAGERCSNIWKLPHTLKLYRRLALAYTIILILNLLMKWFCHWQILQEVHKREEKSTTNQRRMPWLDISQYQDPFRPIWRYLRDPESKPLLLFVLLQLSHCRKCTQSPCE